MNSNIPANIVMGTVDGACLLDNLTYFTRLLREIGFNATPDKTRRAAKALGLIGFDCRYDVYRVLATVFIDQGDQEAIFQQAFSLFWCSTTATIDASTNSVATSAATEKSGRHLEKAIIPPRSTERKMINDEDTQVGIMASNSTVSRQKDFEQMNDAEWRAAMHFLSLLTLTLPPQITRRWQAATTGFCDMRRSAQKAWKTGGEVVMIEKRRQSVRPPVLVILVDISASMSAYVRVLVQLIAVLNTQAQHRIYSFVFGTQLVAIKRPTHSNLRMMTSLIAEATDDWGGGTCIGQSLAAFNRYWSRRLLLSGATVLLATDGLEHGDSSILKKEMKQLRQSCRCVYWLNPLLRYDQYQPLAGGAEVLQHYADKTQAIHNIDNIVHLLGQLTNIRSLPPNRR